jgi:hypothetical protein
MAIDASHRVKKLTGQDNAFNIRFIGELKTRKTNHKTTKVQISIIIDFCIAGSEKLTFIQIE